jgi:putative hydroxymethylpyrimidine transport system permease protein
MSAATIAQRPGPRLRAGAQRALAAMLRQWRAALLLLALIGAWELYVDLGGADPLILPAPHAIAAAMYDDRGLLWSNFLVTAEEVLLGILVAAVAALLLATAMHFSATVRRAVYPLLVASQTIPIPMLAPILVLWLGFGILPKLIVIALVSFFSIVITTLAGFASVDPELLKLVRTFDMSRRRVFFSVELPTALPGVFTGAKIAVIVAVIGAVFAEQSGANSGLGYVFTQALPQLLTARAFAAVVILSLFAIALFGALSLAERLAVPWAHSTGSQIGEMDR